MGHSDAGLQVPALIASPADVSRLRRELAFLDDYLRQEALRSPEHALKLPKTSRLLEGLAIQNKLDLTDEAIRKNLVGFLADVADNAPVVHISFAADPSAAFLQKIVAWFRQNTHPSILVQVGLQPNIAAGCVVRTTNRYYDFSLREHFKKSRAQLIELLEARSAP
jgi:F0F1-type ATP synthase delta subunit